MAVKIQKFIQGELETNSYLVYKNKKAIIIDPTGDKRDIDNFLESNNLTVIAILLTHAHFDHIQLVDYYADKYKIIPYVHPEDEHFFKLPEYNMSSHFVPLTIKCKANKILENKLAIDEFDIKIFETPGHTQGSVCFLIENNLFSGDTIFYNAVGRTDLPTGKRKNLLRSLKKLQKNKQLFNNVYPGHGRIFNIKDFNFNYFFKIL